MASIKHALAACAALAGTAAAPAWAADADIFASSTIFGGPTQTRIICYFTNAGTETLKIKNLKIVGAAGGAFTLVINECGSAAVSTLGPSRSCGIAANVANNVVAACQATTKDKTDLRGVIEARDANQNVLSAQPLR